MDEKKTVKNGDLVLPGDYLGVIEEFLPGDGVREENGELYATRAGKVRIDSDKMEISVEPVTDVPPLPRVGDVVIGRVVEVKPQAVIVQIISIEGRENDREIATSKLAGIHISEIKEGFVEDITKEFKIGDVIRARVIANEKSPIQLSTKGPDLGVVYALCSRCRTPLIRRGDKLICPRCGNVETRKLSSLYRKLKVSL
ncbi:RNA-binding protein, containing S1 domain [Thermococcus kodakarensis KOD1]|uniref:Exosome complex component Csl4 n=1 Tax=Thermococcus kodakarensis (strain ATCC BAA-918 / JCM 12380 / KOD1) TaxID=69014 RepID=Q5JE86_THEKO|nr:exosome complex RNA-binding protein Csl4 [Thermococcus kodakarensis]WCN29110.1 exosome complex RNA-binding protein Csl4 [Thermococcus kodakarensis]WCN31413.1 exosome complex RNA-binding protein Csl4 [Thermococcus kodakarensis]BAD85358.1 RNA-binding protein, containing S1 domain [Thermococcus kodakarensis KOD1]